MTVSLKCHTLAPNFAKSETLYDKYKTNVDLKVRNLDNKSHAAWRTPSFSRVFRTLLYVVFVTFLVTACSEPSFEGVDLSPPSSATTKTSPSVRAEDSPPGVEEASLSAEPDTTSPPAAAVDSIPETSTGNPLDLGRTFEEGVFYLSPDGSDSNDGTLPSQAFGTFNFAANRLLPGDELLVLEGTYEELFRSDTAVFITAKGTAEEWIRITAFPEHDVVVLGPERNAFKLEGAEYVELSNMELVGTGDDLLGAGVHIEDPSHHIRIRNMVVHGFPAGGINVTGSSHIEIAYNEVFGNANFHVTQHSGISLWRPANLGFDDDESGYSNYVIGNTVYDNRNLVESKDGVLTDGNCIILDQGNLTGYNGRTFIGNNICFGNGGRGVNIHESAHADVVNNTIFHNLETEQLIDDNAELMAFDASDARFVNNLVITAPGRRAARSSRSDDIVFVDNLFVSDDPGVGGTNVVVASELVNTVLAAPSIDPTTADFSLVTASPAVDTGRDDFIGILPLDANQTPRLVGVGVDMGALEFAVAE